MTLRIVDISCPPQEAAPLVIRLAGCNLRCSYCTLTWSEGESIELDAIRARVRELGPGRAVCLGGGEPLLQRKAVIALARDLLADGHSVSLKTNGSLSVEGLPKELVAIIEIKTPASGMSGIMNFENVRLARRQHDIFRFVIASRDDCRWALDFVTRHRLAHRYQVCFSPLAPVVSPDWLAEAILTSGLAIRLSPPFVLPFSTPVSDEPSRTDSEKKFPEAKA